MNILFVCTGNTCRSPMAEVIYNARARKSFARSSGFSLSGFPASDLAIETARKHDLDLNDHLSQSTDKASLRDRFYLGTQEMKFNPTPG